MSTETVQPAGRHPAPRGANRGPPSIRSSLVPAASLISLALIGSLAIGWSPGRPSLLAVGAAESPEPATFKYSDQEKTSDYWLRSGRMALDRALQRNQIAHRARSSILFIGDGMSLPTVTAARILYGQLLNKSGEEESLSFEKFDNVALIKTYNVDQQVPDSAATATAILCGVKSNFYTLGVNANVRLNDTNCQRIQQNQVHSILKMASEAGKSTGIVTNTRITHATPAAGYAHVSNRRWECDSYVPRNLDPQCKDIARQLIEDEPGAKLNVIMGGGRRCFFGPTYQDPGPTGQQGIRLDDRNLIDQWLERRKENGARNFAFVNSTQDLRSVDVDKTDYLLGLFSYSHMNYEELRDAGPNGEPSLAEMTEVAIKILSKNPLGYVLMVEGGRIDHAHHENVAGVALRETLSFSLAVQKAVDTVDLRDTLVAVTSDHAHALTINGLAPRGNPILGLSRFKENSTQIPYTTLIYGNGPGNQRPRPDPTVGPNSTNNSPYYVQYAAIHQEEAFHDGSDVAIFASGPYAHLFQGVQEQNYIAHVFAYALCIGNYSEQAHCRLAGQSAIDQQPSASNDLIGTNSIGRADQHAADSSGSGARPQLINNPSLGRPGQQSEYGHAPSSSSAAANGISSLNPFRLASTNQVWPLGAGAPLLLLAMVALIACQLAGQTVREPMVQPKSV